ncbi:divergent polysaccharide deacetylase family protein [uncultured Hyphomonas sp.]|uniref:divergent polysaccharide deacetylase family protein n=1 Tax=uncultured Hyphomonas sp. TaxID=225298 RepID=UPI002AAAC301|nr:divergent polysaccharide deacetylase family protein [uncultured Hyphomonas sp.]
MANRRDGEPSPLRTGVVHTGLSLLVFGGVAGALGAVIYLMGDPSEAGPKQTLALFETTNSAAPPLKTRLKTDITTASLSIETPDYSEDAGSGDLPDLGVDVPDETVVAAAETVDPVGEGDAETAGVRINGKLVKPGESYGEVTRVVSLERAPIAGMTERLDGMTLPRVSPDGLAPADAYARPFINPGNKPVVAIVVGGLGINATHTRSAIDELPPEVTLSFAPDATSLQTWINRARAAGHEVLIETPMEAYDYGRMKMHPLTLLASDNEARNQARLDRILSRSTGYFGLINSQGSKIGDDETAMKPMLQAVSERGLAFIDDGGLNAANMKQLSGETRLRYVRADSAIDAKLSAEDISSEFMELESQALEHGAALGSGFAFPITIEMVKTWTAGLEQKGIVLAPVSALAATAVSVENPGEDSVRTGSLEQPPVNPHG